MPQLLHDGKLYDTEMSEEVARWDEKHSSEPVAKRLRVYRTRKGTPFITITVVGTERLAREMPERMLCSGADRPDEVRHLVAEKCSLDVWRFLFGEPEEA